MKGDVIARYRCYHDSPFEGDPPEGLRYKVGDRHVHEASCFRLRCLR